MLFIWGIKHVTIILAHGHSIACIRKMETSRRCFLMKTSSRRLYRAQKTFERLEDVFIKNVLKTLNIVPLLWMTYTKCSMLVVLSVHFSKKLNWMSLCCRTRVSICLWEVSTNWSCHMWESEVFKIYPDKGK